MVLPRASSASTAACSARTFLLLIALLMPSFSLAQDYPAPNPQSAMQNSIATLEERIATLESQIADAESQNQTARAQLLQQQVAMYKKALATMQEKLKAMPSASPGNSQAAAASAGPSPRLPKRDAAKIATLHTAILSDSELRAFLVKTQEMVDRRIAAKKRALAEQLFKSLKSKPASPAELSAAANGLWSAGQSAVALWLMGKATIENPGPDNLNNYAAFLVMAGAPESALPILWKLDQQYPDNSTVLNNIGQAWFDLGDMDEAKKYLDKAVRRFPGHPQANRSEALIEESKGNKQAAVTYLKNSLSETYSDDREQDLERLGSSLDPDELRKSLGMHKDPLGLEKFNYPRWPKNTDQSDEDVKKWDDFHDAISAENRTLDGMIKSLQDKLKKKQEANSQPGNGVGLVFGGGTDVTENISNDSGPSQGSGEVDFPSPYFRRAVRLQNDAFERYKAFRRHFDAQAPETSRSLDALEKSSSSESAAVGYKYANMPERPGMDEAECGETKAIYNPYLQNANTILEGRAVAYRDAGRSLRDDISFARQFILDPDAYQLDKLENKKEFLGDLTAVASPIFRTAGVCSEGPGEEGGLNLPDFDDIHCPPDKHIKLNLPMVQWEFTCTQARLKYDIVYFKGKEFEDLRTGATKGNVDFMLSAGMGKDAELGPIKGEFRAGVGLSIDYDNGGVSDVALVAVVKGELAPKLDFDPTELPGRHGAAFGEFPSVEAGVEARAGWNAGPSIHGQGLLGGGEAE